MHTKTTTPILTRGFDVCYNLFVVVSTSLIVFYSLGFHGITAHREMRILLLLLQRLGPLLLLRERPPHGPGRLDPQVLADVLGPGGGLPDALLLLLVVHGQHPRDALAHRLDLRDLGGGASGDLRDVELGEELAVLGEGLGSPRSSYALTIFYTLRLYYYIVNILGSLGHGCAGGGGQEKKGRDMM